MRTPFPCCSCNFPIITVELVMCFAFFLTKKCLGIYVSIHLYLNCFKCFLQLLLGLSAQVNISRSEIPRKQPIFVNMNLWPAFFFFFPLEGCKTDATTTKISASSDFSALTGTYVYFNFLYSSSPLVPPKQKREQHGKNSMSDPKHVEMYANHYHGLWIRS